MQFVWDEVKNKSNFKKHHVWFEEAQTVWANPGSLEFFDDDHSDHEDRYIRIGFSTKSRVLMVIFCERGSENIIRIISARKATSKEVIQYEKGI